MWFTCVLKQESQLHISISEKSEIFCSLLVLLLLPLHFICNVKQAIKLILVLCAEVLGVQIICISLGHIHLKQSARQISCLVLVNLIHLMPLFSTVLEEQAAQLSESQSFERLEVRLLAVTFSRSSIFWCIHMANHLIVSGQHLLFISNLY